MENDKTLNTNKILNAFSLLDEKINFQSEVLKQIQADLSAIRADSRNHFERIIRLEERSSQNKQDVRTLQEHTDSRIKQHSLILNKKIDKKVANLKLAVFSALSAAAMSAFSIIKGFLK